MTSRSFAMQKIIAVEGEEGEKAMNDTELKPVVRSGYAKGGKRWRNIK